MYTLIQLKLFRMVVETGSFNKAADEAFITPSAVMKHINNLENEVGAALFTRTHKGQRLIKAGEALYTDALRIFELYEESIAHVANALRREMNVIRLASSIMTLPDAFSEIWEEIQKRHTDLHVELVPFDIVPNSDGWLIPLPGTSIDVVVSTFDREYLRARDLNGLEIMQVPLCANMSLNHRLAQKKILEAEDFEGEHLITLRREKSNDVHDFKEYLKGINVTYSEVDSYGIEVYNRCAGSSDMLLGMGLQMKVHPFVRRVPIRYEKSASYGLLYAKNPTPAVKRFIGAITEILAEAK